MSPHNKGQWETHWNLLYDSYARVCVWIVDVSCDYYFFSVYNVLGTGRAVKIPYASSWKLLQPKMGTDSAYEGEVKFLCFSEYLLREIYLLKLCSVGREK